MFAHAGISEHPISDATAVSAPTAIQYAIPGLGGDYHDASTQQEAAPVSGISPGSAEINASASAPGGGGGGAGSGQTAVTIICG